MLGGLQKMKEVVIIDEGAYDDEISGCDRSDFEVDSVTQTN
jgi:hypothetical protein